MVGYISMKAVALFFYLMHMLMCSAAPDGSVPFTVSQYFYTL